MTTDTLKSYQAARQQQRADALSAYRTLVGKLASGAEDKALFDEADALLSRLGITDADMAGDVDTLRDHAKRQAEVDRFTAEAPKLQERIDELTKAIAKVREEMQTADHRLGAHSKRDTRSAAHGRSRGTMRSVWRS